MMNALALVDERQLATETQDQQAEVSRLEQQADELQVADDGSLMTATDLLGSIAKMKKQVEGTRTGIVKPFNDGVKAINAFFKRFSDPLDRADGTIRGKVLDYQREQARKRREEEERLRALQAKEQAKLEAKAEKKGLPAPPPPPVAVVAGPAKTVSSIHGTATMKTVWDFEIVDPTLVPREYLIVDETKIRAVVKAGVRSIPGCRIFETESLAVRAR